MKEITIDLDNLYMIAKQGVWRTSAFMSFGINSARDKNQKDYQLSNETTYRAMPDNLSEVQIQELKRRYEHWVISCGLRELIETFSVYLSNIYEVCLVIGLNKKEMIEKEFRDKIKLFKWKGVESQLKILRNEFSVETSKGKYLKSINQARNCITHRLGVVGDEDLRRSPTLKICWLALDANIETADGQTIPITPPPKENMYSNNGGNLSVKIVERLKEYQKGDIIKLAPLDLSEICMVIDLASIDILSSTIEYTKKIGVEIIKTEPTETH